MIKFEIVLHFVTYSITQRTFNVLALCILATVRLEDKKKSYKTSHLIMWVEISSIVI